MTDKDILKNSLTEQDITDIVKGLGAAAPTYDNHNNLIFETVCHNPPGMGKFKLYYYDNTKLFTCYTDCGESFDIYELVKRAKLQEGNVLSFLDAIDYVKNYKHVEGDIDRELCINDWDFIKQYYRKKMEQIRLPVYQETYLEKFLSMYYIGWIKEGISIQTMRKYGIKYCPIENKIIIPHYDKEGRLIGIRGRALDPIEVTYRKYAPVTIQRELCSYPVSFNLYGLNFNHRNILKNNKIILFEGEKSVLKCESFYPNNNISVAVLGSNISNYQREMVLDLKIEEIIIAFDKEWENRDEKIASLKKMQEVGRRFAPYARVYLLFDKNDELIKKGEAPCDRGKETMESLLRQKIEVTTAIR